MRAEDITDEINRFVLVILYEELAQHAYAAALGLIHGGDCSDDCIFQEPTSQEDLIPRLLQLVKQTEEQKTQPLLKCTQSKYIHLPERSGTF